VFFGYAGAAAVLPKGGHGNVAAGVFGRDVYVEGFSCVFTALQLACVL